MGGVGKSISGKGLETELGGDLLKKQKSLQPNPDSTQGSHVIIPGF